MLTRLRFKLAEKLADRIEGCNKDLTDMIEEINTVSAMLNNTSGNDDPVCNTIFTYLTITNCLKAVTCCSRSELTFIATTKD
jgi:hypothetical protein